LHNNVLQANDSPSRSLIIVLQHNHAGGDIMKLSTLVAELNDPASGWLSRSQKTQDIFSYELYLPDSALYPGVVYVLDFKDLPEHAPPETCFFCVGVPADTAVKHEYCSIVSFGGELLTLLRNVGLQMTIEHKLQSDKQILMEALNSGRGLQNLIDTAFSMLKSPIIVVDSAYKILAMSSTVIESRPDLEQQRELGHMMDENLKSLRQERVYEKTRQIKYPYYSVEPMTKTGWLNTLIYAFGIEAAEMGVMEHDREFTHYDYELTHFLSQLISLELQKNDFYKNNQALMHSTLLADLLGGRLRDTTALSRARQLGWSLTETMYVLTIFDRNYGVSDHKAQVICDHIHTIYQNSRWVILESKIVFLLILGREEKDTADGWQPLKEYLSANKLTASASDCFSDLFAVRWKYAQCEAAYSLGSQLKPGAELYFYKDYQVHHVGSIVLKEHPASILYHPGVIAMDKYDRENGTEFVATLKEYFREVNDPGGAAKNLYIHKNTLFYRINKAKELFDLDISDGYERLRIYMTMIFMEL
jgi:sugar diacid utilization regulator